MQLPRYVLGVDPGPCSSNSICLLDIRTKKPIPGYWRTESFKLKYQCKITINNIDDILDRWKGDNADLFAKDFIVGLEYQAGGQVIDKKTKEKKHVNSLLNYGVQLWFKMTFKPAVIPVHKISVNNRYFPQVNYTRTRLQNKMEARSLVSKMFTPTEKKLYGWNGPQVDHNMADSFLIALYTAEELDRLGMEAFRVHRWRIEKIKHVAPPAISLKSAAKMSKEELNQVRTKKRGPAKSKAPPKPSPAKKKRRVFIDDDSDSSVGGDPPYRPMARWDEDAVIDISDSE